MCPIRRTSDSGRLCLSETLRGLAKRLIERGKQNVKDGKNQFYVQSAFVGSL